MKKLLSFLLAATLSGLAFGQNPPASLDLQFHWDDDTLPVASPGGLNLQYNSVWGVAVNGHEVAVLGNARYILFFDVTDPSDVQLVGKFEGQVTTIWREFKGYKNRVYAVSDQTQEGLQIFDLSKYPAQPITRSYWSNEFFNSAHSIEVDTVSGRIYLNGSNVASSGMLILNVNDNPDQPSVCSSVTLSGGYIHDSYVRCDTLYASSGYAGYYIYDFKTVPTQPKTLAFVSTGGYNHNSWLTLDGKYAYYTEEIPKGRPIQIVDLQKLRTQSEITTVGSFLDQMVTPLPPQPQAIAHNVYIRCNYLFVSQYEDGLLVYDISDPLHPQFAYWYDTHPSNTIYNGYFGCWGNYPWLPSGTILASDMQDGLYVFGAIPNSNCQTPNPCTGPIPACTVVANHEAPDATSLQVLPNPNNGLFNVKLGEETDWTFRLLSANGAVLKTGKSVSQIDISNLPGGVYFLEIQAVSGEKTVRRVVKN